MPIVFDSNPEMGTVQTYDYNPDRDEHIITTHEDVSGLLEALKHKRNTAAEHGKVEEWAHYCSIPNTVIIELKNKGIDIFDKNCTKRLLAEINTNYPWLKATNKHHG